MLKQVLTTNKYQNLFLILSIITVPIIIFLYFLRWKTSVIYGDDLSIYTNFLDLHSFYEKLNFPLPSGKFRPIHGLSGTFLVETFQKSLVSYYIFNIGIQALIAFCFALIANLFLKSPIYSLLVGLTVGISRFAFFNMTQLFNGGALEGLAMMFFLLSLYFILRVLVNSALNTSQKQKELLVSIVFANLCIYTHERYIVTIPFIILLLLFFPNLKDINLKHRIKLVLIALFSIALNIFLKKYVYSMPFLVGTGGTNISFSFSTAFQFFIEAILSIVQINSGPQHLVGMPFSILPIPGKLLVLLFLCTLLCILALYISKNKKVFGLRQTKNYLLLYISKKQASNYKNLSIIISLIVLFLFLLTSAIVTIRLEPRWLQAPLSVFILMIVIAISSLQFRKTYVKNLLLLAFIFFFLSTDYIYLSKGANNIYFVSTEKVAVIFKQAVDNNTIHTNIDNLYIWKRHEDYSTEPTLRWCLIDGAFFGYYQNKNKKLTFIDSTTTNLNIDKNVDQIIYVDSQGITELTDLYLQNAIPPALISEKSSDNTPNSFSTLKVLQWGPEETKTGVVPNVQPDGKMGIWMSVSSTAGIGEVQILFDGHPMPTAISANGITAGVPVSELLTPGDKKIEIQSITTKETILVGTFKVVS